MTSDEGKLTGNRETVQDNDTVNLALEGVALAAANGGQGSSHGHLFDGSVSVPASVGPLDASLTPEALEAVRPLTRGAESDVRPLVGRRRN